MELTKMNHGNINNSIANNINFNSESENNNENNGNKNKGNCIDSNEGNSNSNNNNNSGSKENNMNSSNINSKINVKNINNNSKENNISSNGGDSSTNNKNRIVMRATASVTIITTAVTKKTTSTVVTSTARPVKQQFIIGDSMVKKIDGYLVTSSINHRYIVKVKPFLSAKTIDMVDYIKPTQRDFNPDLYLLHAETNDLSSNKSPEQISLDISNIVNSLKLENNTVIVSSIVPSDDEIKKTK